MEKCFLRNKTLREERRAAEGSFAADAAYMSPNALVLMFYEGNIFCDRKLRKMDLRAKYEARGYIRKTGACFPDISPSK